MTDEGMNGIYFVKRIDEKLDNTGKKRAELLRDLELPRQSITNWSDRGNIPAGDICLKIARYLGVSVEWLITGQEQQEGNEDAQLGQGIRAVWSTLSERERAAADVIFGGFFSGKGLAA